MEARVELVRLGIEPGPPAHMSEHVSERLTLQPAELEEVTTTRPTILYTKKHAHIAMLNVHYGTFKRTIACKFLNRREMKQCAHLAYRVCKSE